MQLTTNTLILDGVATRVVIRPKFAAVNVLVVEGRDKAWIDLVTFDSELIEQFALIEEGEKVKAVCHPQSNKREGHGWQLRFICDELKR